MLRLEWKILFKTAFWIMSLRLTFTRNARTLPWRLRDYSSGRIGFSVNNKRHSLPTVYTMLVSIWTFLLLFYSEFYSLLFYSELNVVRGSYVWIFKWLNFHCNYIKLISALNFLKQWVTFQKSIKVFS